MWHYLKDGGYYPRGGGQSISARLAEEIEARGGKLLLGSRVEKVVVRRGAVEGVTFHNKHLGRRFVRTTKVVSNADYRQTLLSLVGRGHLSGRAYSQAREAEMSPALGIVFLGVKRDLAAEGIPNTNFWVYPGRDIESGYQEVADGAMPHRPMAYLSMASLKDPDNPALAPPGRANLQLMSLAPAGCESWGLSKAEVKTGTYRRSEVYRSLKQRYADRLIERAEQVLPGLRHDIELCVVATPLTHNRYTLASGGTPYGLALTPQQFGFHRPGVSTEISGLYLCGASCKTSHGILGCMMSGVLAASKVAGPAVTRAVFNRAFGDPGTQGRKDVVMPSGT
jgi:phytoene dehydrogenase-like protein